MRTSLESKFPLISSVLLVWKKVTISRARLISQQIMYFWYKTGHFRITPSPRFKTRLQNSRFFSPKISKEIGKAWRKSRARASHARRTCEAREKKRLSVFHTMSSFRPGASKMSSSCQKSVRNSALFVNLIDSRVIIDAVIQ